MAFKCPGCNRPIYNRRRKACEFCGDAIPDSLLFTSRQSALIERLKTDESKQHREFMERDLHPGSGDHAVVYLPVW